MPPPTKHPCAGFGENDNTKRKRIGRKTHTTQTQQRHAKAGGKRGITPQPGCTRHGRQGIRARAPSADATRDTHTPRTRTPPAEQSKTASTARAPTPGQNAAKNQTPNAVNFPHFLSYLTTHLSSSTGFGPPLGCSRRRVFFAQTQLAGFGPPPGSSQSVAPLVSPLCTPSDNLCEHLCFPRAVLCLPTVLASFCSALD